MFPLRDKGKGYVFMRKGRRTITSTVGRDPYWCGNITVMLIPNDVFNFSPVTASLVVITSTFLLSLQTALWDKRLPWAQSKDYFAPFLTFQGLRSKAVPGIAAQLHVKAAPFILWFTQLSCQSNTETQDEDQKTQKVQRGCAAGPHLPSATPPTQPRLQTHSGKSSTLKVL